MSRIRLSVDGMFVRMGMRVRMTIGMSMGMIVRGLDCRRHACRIGRVLAERQRCHGVLVERFYLDICRRQLAGSSPDGAYAMELEFTIQCGQAPAQARVHVIAQRCASHVEASRQEHVPRNAAQAIQVCVHRLSLLWVLAAGGRPGRRDLVLSLLLRRRKICHRNSFKLRSDGSQPLTNYSK
jgi:hypothetical protein